MTRLLDRFNNHISKNRKNGTSFSLESLVGSSSSITQAIRKARKVASIKSTVTLIGETGSGKELFAQGIHNASSSASQPFIAVNCAAIPETLMESLMMGTVKGAFSGAIDAPGFVEQAENGTLFLDEINSLSLQLQPKLLRLLQDKTVRRIGGKIERKINCRIICASNENLFELSEKGQFREDLLYRLTAVVLDIPPLRERPEDIPLLAQKIINDFNKAFDLNIREITPELSEFFKQYDWPGNVRELENIIESAMSLSNKNDTLLTIEHVPAIIKRRMEKTTSFRHHINTELFDGENLNAFLRKCEKEFIESTLAKYKGNVAAAAKQLGIARQNLHYRLRKLSIEPDIYRG
ncbi:MAG: sigma-54 interaction domain-containing protein [Bacillota bacterium]